MEVSARLPLLKGLVRLRFGLIAAFVVLLAFPSAGWAQRATASINGTVKDASGAVIPGATITLTNIDTSVERTVTSNPTGEYVILDIPPGRYTIQGTKEGFSPLTYPEFSLYVNQTATFDFNLPVGTSKQSVTVEATSSRVEASTAELGTAIASREVDDLPLNGRNFTELLSLTPGVSPISVAQNSGGWTAQPVGSFSFPSVNGQNNRSNFFMLDGINDQGSFQSTYGIEPIIDGIQEFKVQSHNDEAQFGGALGGIVNVVTKSGTNSFHGDAFEFLRNNVLDSRDFFLADVTPFKQNQFGGTIGGPVILPGYNGRNKTFFFATYEGFRRHTSSTTIYNVPTLAEESGDLTALGTSIYNPWSTRPDPSNPGKSLRDSFMCDASGNPLPATNNIQAAGIPCSKIPSSMLSPGMVLYAKTLYPAPTTTGVAGFNGLDLTPTILPQDTGSMRFDEQLSSRDSLFARYTGLTQPSTASGGYVGLRSATYYHGYQVGVSWIHTFSGNAVLQTSFGRNSVQYIVNTRYTSVQNPATLNQQVGFAANFVRPFYNGATWIPQIPLSGFMSGGEGTDKNHTSDIYEYKADFSKIHGRHTLKMGVDISTNNYQALTGNLNDAFSSFETSNLETSAGGSPLASFLLAVPDSAGRFDTWATEYHGWEDGFYFQDQWKATDKLTVNLGLRYDVSFLPLYGSDADGNDQVGTLNLNNGTFLLERSSPACSATQGAPCIPGGLPQPHVSISPNRALYQNNYDNWQPRIGLAYRVSPKLVVRASAGKFYDNWAAITQSGQNETGNWPSVGHLLGNNLNPLVPTKTAYDPFNLAASPLVYPTPSPFQVVEWYDNLTNQIPYSEQWNFGAQYQLSPSTVLTASYVGSHSSRLDLGDWGNTALTPGPGSPQDRAPYPYITPTYYDRTVGRSSYNAFEFSLDRKSSRGLSYIISYTWGKSLDIGCSGWYATEGCSVQDAYHVDRDKSVSGFDLTQILSVNWVYQLPFGKGMKFSTHSRALDAIVGNWQFNGIMFMASGPPYYMSASGDIANTGASGYERLNLVGNPNLSNPTPSMWVNKSAFAVPAPYTFGNEGRFDLRSEGSNNFDLSIFRQFPITESKRLEFRVEAFNAFNRTQFAAPDTTFSDPTFGVVSSIANTPRQVQFALKFYF